MAEAEGGVTGVHEADAWVELQFREPSRADLRRKDESGNTRVAPKGATPVFLPFPVILVPRLNLLPVFDGLDVLLQRGTKNTGYYWLIPTTI